MLPKSIRLSDCLVPFGLLAGFAVVWPLSGWSLTTALSIGVVFGLMSIAAFITARTQRQKLESAAQDNSALVESAEARHQELAKNHHAIELELQHLRDRFDEMESVKERFLANISHEIRTPMNGIFGMTELLNQTQLNSKQKRYAETIRRSTESLLGIVNDVLDFSKIQNDEIQLDSTDFLLSELLEDVCDHYAEVAQKGGIEIICDVAEIEDTAVNGDPARVRQLLNNLVSNAVKFTEFGEIVVSATRGPIENQFVVKVADTGMGVPADIQDHIFREFAQADGSTTRRFGGTGLGLSIANKLVSLMGGKLTLDSVVDQGSTFTFTCTLAPAIDAVQSRRQLKEISNTRALIVDDNETNSAILVHQLEQWGISVVSVDSGKAALAVLEQVTSDNNLFDIAILDLHMPDMDGLELASLIQCNVNYAPMKLMMLTSSLTNMTSEELQGIGIRSALTKPARQTELYNAITELVANKHESETISPILAAKTDKPKILLTEDNPINQEVALGMLESLGCEVEIAENGSEAVDALASKQFDLVLMDCQMPVMDGFEATRTIRSQSCQQNIPVVALTANALEGDRELCIASGMDDYLKKPVNQHELQGTIEKWLHQKSTDTKNPISSPTPSPEVPETMNFDFDEKALDAIKVLQRPGRPDILGKIINMYLDKTPELIADIEGGIAANDAARVKMAAHTLKSSSAYLGATTLADQCNRLETKAANEDLSDSSENVDNINTGFQELCEKIKKFA